MRRWIQMAKFEQSRIQRYRRLECLTSFLSAAKQLKRVTEKEISDGRRRIHFHAPVVSLPGGLDLPSLLQGMTVLDPDRGVVGVEDQSLSIVSGSEFPLPPVPRRVRGTAQQTRAAIETWRETPHDPRSAEPA